MITEKLLDQETVKKVFFSLWLEGEYDFIMEDLEKIANAYAEAAAPKIARKERDACLEIANSLNYLVANKIEEVRGKM